MDWRDRDVAGMKCAGPEWSGPAPQNAVSKKEDAVERGVLSTIYSPGVLRGLYDRKALDAVDQTHRRALVAQEKLRVLLGIPTWSVTNAPPPSSKKADGWKLW